MRKLLASRVGKGSLGLSILAALVGLGVSTASASPIPGISSLQDLINRGPALQNGIVIGDKTFYNFAYQGSSNGPTPSQISVGQPPGPDIGLQFSYAWFSENGLAEDSVIQYCVHVNVPPAPPGTAIDAVTLTFNGTAPVPGALTGSAVTETVTDLQGHVLANFGVFDDGAGGLTNIDQRTATITPPQGDICVTKDIQLNSAAISAGGGVATISVVDNTYHQIPEPAAIGLLSLGGLGLLRRRR